MSKTGGQADTSLNPVGLDGIDFVEFASPEPDALRKMFLEFGFARTLVHAKKKIDLYQQNDISFFVNYEPTSFAWTFSKKHGPSASSMGWRVKNARTAFEVAVQRGAKPAVQSDFTDTSGKAIPAIIGIGDSLIYFIEDGHNPKRYQGMNFIPHVSPDKNADKGFMVVDHLTNNVFKGTMETWANFYKDIFGFTEVRYFDIRGVKTGLTSYALRSPCGKFCIPINEADEKKSQINEYLDVYKGPGIQHIAFLTDDIIASLEKMRGTSITMLDMDNAYYNEVFKRVPNVKEDKAKIQDLNILVDGDDKGYLLQIFTQNLVGPIFIEIIQRRNNLSFGEGNFGALFRAIERDQMKRGVL